MRGAGHCTPTLKTIRQRFSPSVCPDNLAFILSPFAHPIFNHLVDWWESTELSYQVR